MKKLLTVLLLGLLFLSCGKKEEEKAPKENGKFGKNARGWRENEN